MKSRDRGKKIALASGLGFLAVAGLILCLWEGIVAWYVGYRFVWMPEGAATRNSRHPINASGEVAVGPEPPDMRAGLWSLATREVLSLEVPLAGGEISVVHAINDAGDLVGLVSPVAWPSGAHPARAILWTRGARVMDLATLGGHQTVATDINERGQVVGWSTLSLNNVARACLWSTESGIADLGSVAPGKESRAHAINETGWVVGDATDASGSLHPFLWRPETKMQDLGLPSGFSGGDARDINDQGKVLMSFHNKMVHTPFLWTERDGLVKLPAPPGFDNVEALALNNRGTVLLQAIPADRSSGFIGYLVVNSVLEKIPGIPGAKANRYCGLNDKGWVVGAAQRNEDGGAWRGFVALPAR